MKTWLKNFVLFLSLSVMGSSMALACQISGTGLPEEMQQKLKVQCEQMKLDAATLPAAPKVTKEELSEWAAVSQEFAKAIGIAAKELGVAVNDFLNTPAGILTAGVIIWHTLGADIVKLLSIFGVAWVVYLFNRALWFSHYETIPRSFMGVVWNSRVRRQLKWEDLHESAMWWIILSVMALIGYIAVVLATLG